MILIFFIQPIPIILPIILIIVQLLAYRTQMTKDQNQNKMLVFILTNLAAQTIYGYFSVYSIVKYPLIKTLHLNSQFLGTLESIGQLGSLVSSFIVMFLVVKAKKFCIFVSALGFITSLAFIPLHYVPNIGIIKFVLIIVSFVRSFCFECQMFLYLIFTKNYKSDKSYGIQSVWFIVSSIGCFIGLIFAHAMLNYFHVRWDFIMVIWHFIWLIMSILVDVCIKQVEIFQIQQLVAEQQEKQQSSGSDNFQNIQERKNEMIEKKQKQNENENEKEKQKKYTKSQFLSLTKILAGKFLSLLKQKRVLLYLLSSKFCFLIYEIFLLWIPFYYSSRNFKEYSSLSLLGVDLSLFLGGIFVQFILLKCIKNQKISKWVIFILFALSFGVITVIWISTNLSIILELCLLFASMFLYCCHSSRMYVTVPLQICGQDELKLQLLVKLSGFFIEFLNIISFFLIGFLMEKTSKSFWTIVWIVYLLAVLFEILRLYEERNYDQQQVHLENDNQKQSANKNENKSINVSQLGNELQFKK